MLSSNDVEEKKSDTHRIRVEYLRACVIDRIDPVIAFPDEAGRQIMYKVLEVTASSKKFVHTLVRKKAPKLLLRVLLLRY